MKGIFFLLLEQAALEGDGEMTLPANNFLGFGPLGYASKK
jgi:hypothetical protein